MGSFLSQLNLRVQIENVLLYRFRSSVHFGDTAVSLMNGSEITGTSGDSHFSSDKYSGTILSRIVTNRL